MSPVKVLTLLLRVIIVLVLLLGKVIIVINCFLSSFCASLIALSKTVSSIKSLSGKNVESKGCLCRLVTIDLGEVFVAVVDVLHIKLDGVRVR